MDQNSNYVTDGINAARKSGLSDSQIYQDMKASSHFKNSFAQAAQAGLSDAEIARDLGLKYKPVDKGSMPTISVNAKAPFQPFDWKASQKEEMLKQAKEKGPTSWGESALLGFSDLGAGIQQGINYAADGLSGAINKVAGTNLDTKSYDRATKQRQEIIDFHNLTREQNEQGFDGWRLGGAIAGTAPLMLTGGGGALSFAGRGALSGGLISGAGFAKNSEERLRNTKFGAVGGAVGGVVAKGLTTVASKASDKISRNAVNKVLDAPRNQLTKESRNAGYTVPPSYSNPNILNKSLAKISGEADLAKIASSKNQDITNALAKQSLGLPINKPITEASLQGVRQQAGQAYDVVRSLGRIKVDQTFRNDMDSIIKPYADLSQDFQLKLSSDVLKALEQVKPKNGEFEASAAIHAIRSLRNEAKKAYKAGDVDLGKATKSAAEVLERQLDRAVGKSTLSNTAIANFKNARQLIAKTHTIEDAMDEVGDVSANKLASMLGKGAPLTSELKQAAQFASVYPQLNNVGRSGGGGLSLFDGAAGIGGSMATGGSTGLAVALTRPSLRYFLNTGLAGKMGTPNYNSRLSQLLQHSDRLAPIAPVAGAHIGKNKSNQ